MDFATGDDPVKMSLVAGLNRPGGNVTGFFFYSGADLQSKQLELLREAVPEGRRDRPARQPEQWGLPRSAR